MNLAVALIKLEKAKAILVQLKQLQEQNKTLAEAISILEEDKDLLQNQVRACMEVNLENMPESGCEEG